MKHCNECFLEKPLTEFHKNLRAPDGLRNKCKECAKNRQKKWRLENTERHKVSVEKWQRENVEYYKQYVREYQQTPEFRKHQREYEREQLANNEGFRMCLKARTHARKLYAGKLQNSKLLGCDRETFVRHIESQFKDGMTHSNKNVIWEFDHIYPLSRAFREGCEKFAEACHYGNIRPLSIDANRKKRDKVEL